MFKKFKNKIKLNIVRKEFSYMMVRIIFAFFLRIITITESYLSFHGKRYY